MSEFASETSQAAQEEVQDVQVAPEGSETLGASTGANDALEKDPAEWVSGDVVNVDGATASTRNGPARAGDGERT